jgi:glycine/D-amino acid oxidase-like deaminating enzyme
MPDVIVVGGGIIGCSVAYRLAQQGARVTLIEGNRLAGGTSGTSFAWMNANNKPPLPYHRLNLAGMSEHSRLREEFGDAPWLHVHGNVMWGNSSRVSELDDSLTDKINRLREWGYPVEQVSERELADIHPDLAPPADVETIAYFPTEGYVDVPLLIATLARAAKSLGARVVTGQPVVGFVQHAGRVRGVRTAGGDQFGADMVVSCAGRWTDQVSELTGVTIPMAPTLGLLVTSSPTVTTLRALTHTMEANIRPEGGSRILMASYQIDSLLRSHDSLDQLRAYASEILERATTILPALAGSTVDTFRLAVRSIPSDGFPAVGSIGGLDGFYAISTHSGVTMGPLLGRIAATEVLAGERDDRLATFRPERLVALHTTR